MRTGTTVSSGNGLGTSGMGNQNQMNSNIATASPVFVMSSKGLCWNNFSKLGWNGTMWNGMGNNFNQVPVTQDPCTYIII